MRLALAGLFILAFAGCQTSKSKQNLISEEKIQIQDSAFTKQTFEDPIHKNWITIELRPESLPYTGKMAEMNAEKRWLRMFDGMLQSMQVYCAGTSPYQMPAIEGDETNYSRFNSDLTYPKWIRARFTCQ